MEYGLRDGLTAQRIFMMEEFQMYRCGSTRLREK